MMMGHYIGTITLMLSRSLTQTLIFMRKGFCPEGHLTGDKIVPITVLNC